MICDGRKSLYISEKVNTSKKNIDYIRTKLMQKFNVSTSNELMRVAILYGFYKPRTNFEIENDLNINNDIKKIQLKKSGL